MTFEETNILKFLEKVRLPLLFTYNVISNAKLIKDKNQIRII
jgi:hypothetical protein